MEYTQFSKEEWKQRDKLREQAQRLKNQRDEIQSKYEETVNRLTELCNIHCWLGGNVPVHIMWMGDDCMSYTAHFPIGIHTERSVMVYLNAHHESTYGVRLSAPGKNWFLEKFLGAGFTKKESRKIVREWLTKGTVNGIIPELR